MSFRKMLDQEQRWDSTKRVINFIDRFVKPLVLYSVAMLLVECYLYPDVDSHNSHPFFLWSERVVALVFTLEYIFRCWRNSGRGNYATSAFGIIDLVAILPFWIGFVPFVAPYLHLIRTLRVLRMLKFFRYSRELQLMALAFYRAYFNLKPLIFTTVMVLLFTMFALYEIEGPHQEEFRNLFTIGWFLEVTATTVGYGDLSPVTTAGKIIVMCFMIIGLAIFMACFSAITAAFDKVFAEEADPDIDPLAQFAKVRAERRALVELDKDTGTTTAEDATPMENLDELIYIGQVAVFYVPIQKLDEMEFGTDGQTPRMMFEQFLMDNYNAYTLEISDTQGFWREHQKSHIFEDKNARYEIFVEDVFSYERGSDLSNDGTEKLARRATEGNEMKFEQLHPHQMPVDERVPAPLQAFKQGKKSFTDKPELERDPEKDIPNFVIKSPELGRCQMCDSYTRWMDVRLGQYMCSEECDFQFWNTHAKKLVEHMEHEHREAEVASRAKDAWKDIIIVVHNELPYLQQCVESIRRHTKNCTLYIWNNNSDEDVQSYLDGLMNVIEPGVFEIEVRHHPENIGFIEPNNTFAELGDGDYIILLNSDCMVFEGWDKTLLGHLQDDPDLAEVGYLGGALDGEGKGIKAGRYGYDIDFVCGWCVCISRDTYEEFGLFNKQLTFAYGEDSDLSLRLKAADKKILALYTNLVLHHGNKTVNRVSRQGTISTLKETFEANHRYVKEKWRDYLENDRVLLNKSSITWRGKEASNEDSGTTE
ncbi:KCND2 [Symbiodinium microadriaticum]|nr:KCND2 [Symbiodinium microadriaticum]